MGRYSEDPAWADVVPLPTDTGGPNPLAAIAYSDEYAETMSYLRAVMAANEHSERVLDLTEDLIDMNPAHYTVWLYRATTLFALGTDLRVELEWLNETALRYLKNYQIWHHRNLIVDKLDSCEGESDFIEGMFEQDAKNYHVWAYRQWLVKRFDLWDQGEVEFTDKMLQGDIRNNSAWNHRWFVIFGRPGQVSGPAGEELRQREMQFALDAIRKAPQSQSPWNYLRAVVLKSSLPLSTLKEIALEFADTSKPNGVRSSHALELLAEIFAEEGDGGERAITILDLLTNKYDPIRKNYWQYQKARLSKSAVATVAS
ncbi:protein prenylyltransferase [Polychaeton citri CBS 116435]|uniref:Protein farnesyltransferase/geranylgeranyltransferase type-1 subunit alpha n=1 Tax=Polychaeton citri CBS 116435 TaxID=1314669 RepID=A0A9P4QH12_9PEZI|nr:protein prenylyltransferase [Polychaeton citri CBS 116435]